VALSTKTHFWDDVVILRCVGRLVAGVDTITFRQEVEKLLSARRKVIVNLTEVDHIDSTGHPRLFLEAEQAEQRLDERDQARVFQNIFDGVAPTHEAGHGPDSVCERRGCNRVILKAGSSKAG
jgi:ABC-type transporter Mla MlaB component